MAELYGGAVGTALSVVLDQEGLTGLDEYTIAFEGSWQVKLCDFQLTHVGVNRNPQGERA